MDKFTQLLDAIESPECYSQADIETMLKDPETREGLVVLDKLKSGLVPITTPDVEKEWEKFENNHRLSTISRWKTLRDFVSRNIAATIAICILSFTAMATIVSIGISRLNGDKVDQYADNTTVTTAAISPPKQKSVKTDSTEESSTGEIIIFDEETLENIVNSIATHYGYTVVFDDDAPKSLRLYFRWNQNMDVEDVIARLNNFEQIHMSIDEKIIKVD